MVQMPSPSSSAEKFSRRGSQASQDYQTGVEGSSDNDWSEGALQNAGNWETAIQDAIANGSFESGVRNPAASWQQRSLEVGAQRFGPGVQAAEAKYEQAVGPYFEALEALSLSPRGPRGSQQNYQRVEEVGRRLNELRSQR